MTHIVVLPLCVAGGWALTIWVDYRIKFRLKFLAKDPNTVYPKVDGFQMHQTKISKDNRKIDVPIQNQCA